MNVRLCYDVRWTWLGGSGEIQAFFVNFFIVFFFCIIFYIFENNFKYVKWINP